MKKIIFLVVFFNPLLLSAQSKISLSFGFLFEKEKFTIKENTYHHFKNGDSILIETLRFYISNIEFLQDEKVVWKEANSVHLIDATLAKTLKITTDFSEKIKFNQLKFDLGIDSTTNVSGALGGDLDPTKGMYWTWQSGYINFKIEGKTPKSNARNQAFQYHLGGYLSPYYALQKVILPIKKKGDILVRFDVADFLAKSDFSKKSHLMSPSAEAVLLSERVAKGFLGWNDF